MNPKFPLEYAQHFGVLLDQKEGAYQVLYYRSLDWQTIAEIQRFLSGEVLDWQYLSEADWQEALLSAYHRPAASIEVSQSEKNDELQLITDVLQQEEDPTVTRLLNQILVDALRLRASDIHFEPQKDLYRIRFRTDGLLFSHLELPTALAHLCVSRIKILAHMDIAQRRLPQDGRLSFYFLGQLVDVRVATVPVQYGERLVLRLLAGEAKGGYPTHLGMTSEQQKTVAGWLDKPYGLILVTGPTGAGKTTSIYEFLKRLQSEQRNIITIEDPIEYHVPGVNQAEAHAAIGFDFSDGLRAILRQDPDVVLIGEIRDTQTAQVALQASLTGHLVLATLHAQDAPSAFKRLKQLGVAQEDLLESLLGIVAQRLVRRLCVKCRQPLTPEVDNSAPSRMRRFRAQGCPECQYTGYYGRFGVFECLSIDAKTCHMLAQPLEFQFREWFQSQHFTLKDAARQVLEAGETTVEEIKRVLPWEE